MSGSIPSNSGQGFYRPGGIDLEYDKLQKQAPLPGVQPPTGAAEAAAAAVVIESGYYDEGAPDVLALIQGGTFNPPFTVTLMRREGMQVFKSDAGTKREANFVLCKETIRDPADMLRITAGIVSEVYKPLNNMSLDFQLMLYLATQHGALKLPAQPPQKAVEVAQEATVEP
jgi:hypothetical protein